jgi:SAM-dependent MidA family methyltransferase
VHGVILANELLDALPTHLVEMTGAGLLEVLVAVDGDRLIEQLGPPSTPELPAYLARVGVTLRPGWRAEINLAATAWVREAAWRLQRGFLVLIDYGHPAPQLYSEARASGTLATFSRHTSLVTAPGEGQAPPWLADPGSHDITAHVDLTSATLAAEGAGLTTLMRVDQTYFLLGLGLADRLAESTGSTRRDLERRLALKTLMLPGGLGSTHKVMIYAKDVGIPPLRGGSFGARLT